MSAYSYTLEKSPVPAESWVSYTGRTIPEFQSLLDESATEADLQSFLEANPAFVPCESGLTVFKSSLFSEPILPGFRSKRPDFMWIGYNSVERIPILIEIEQPDKPWYTKNCQLTAKFTQAYDQLVEWRTWFNSPSNIPLFVEGYKLNEIMHTDSTIKPRFYLIYGRRENIPKIFSHKRASSFKNDEIIMTYNRLAPSADQGNRLCIRLAESQFEAISFPSTGRIGPQVIDDWIDISKLDDSIDGNRHIHAERKAFLKRRLPYWKAWYNDKSTMRIVNSGDWE